MILQTHRFSRFSCVSYSTIYEGGFTAAAADPFRRTDRKCSGICGLWRKTKKQYWYSHAADIMCAKYYIHCCIGSNNAKAKKKKCALIKLDFLAFPLKASGGRENYWHAIA